MSTTTTKTKPNDRDARGRFLKGCAGGPGNPDGKRLAKLRSVLLRSVSEQDIGRVVDRLIQLTGDTDPKVRLLAIRELLDRTLGKPKPMEADADAPQQFGIRFELAVDPRKLTPEEFEQFTALRRKGVGHADDE
ncbi:MAG: hypothetical protein AAGD32_13660 [Planctomycetota bacterium]